MSVDVAPIVGLAIGTAVTALLAKLRAARVEARILDSAHELSRPLGALRLALDSLPEGPKRAALLAEVERAVSGLDDLRCSGSGPGRGRTERFDLGRLVDEISGTWSIVAARSGRRLVVDGSDSIPVRGDRARLGQAVTNLVANALEHGSGLVRIRVVSDASGLGFVDVEDEGAGTDARWSAGVGTRRPGRGRGTRIASRTVRAAGGELSRSVSGDGSRARVSIPVSRPSR